MLLLNVFCNFSMLLPPQGCMYKFQTDIYLLKHSRQGHMASHSYSSSHSLDMTHRWMHALPLTPLTQITCLKCQLDLAELQYFIVQL